MIKVELYEVFHFGHIFLFFNSYLLYLFVSAPTECVSPVYWWTTYILIFITAVLGISIIFLINKRLKVCQTNKDPKCVDSDSSTDSLQLLQGTYARWYIILMDCLSAIAETADRFHVVFTLFLTFLTVSICCYILIIVSMFASPTSLSGLVAQYLRGQ